VKKREIILDFLPWKNNQPMLHFVTEDFSALAKNICPKH
jgi:hypothetical protein